MNHKYADCNCIEPYSQLEVELSAIREKLQVAEIALMICVDDETSSAHKTVVAAEAVRKIRGDL